MILTGALSLGMQDTQEGRIVLAREICWLSSIGIGLIGFTLELFSPEKRWKKMKWMRGGGKIRLDDSEDEDEDEGTGAGKNEDGDMESPVVTANLYERLTFSWLTREPFIVATKQTNIPALLSLGTRKFLAEEDMWMLPAEDSAEALSNRLAATWERQRDLVKKGKKSKPSLKIAIAQAYGGPYILAGVFKGLYDALSFLQPQLLKLLLAYVSSYGTDHPMPAVAGYAIAITMFLTANLATSFLHQYFDRCFTTSKLLSPTFKVKLTLQRCE